MIAPHLDAAYAVVLSTKHLPTEHFVDYSFVF
jgi:hypothetical protein